MTDKLRPAHFANIAGHLVIRIELTTVRNLPRDLYRQSLAVHVHIGIPNDRPKPRNKGLIMIQNTGRTAKTEGNLLKKVFCKFSIPTPGTTEFVNLGGIFTPHSIHPAGGGVC